MQNDSILADHSYTRIFEMCNSLLREALKQGLSETKAVRLPLIGWMSVYGGGGESVMRMVNVSFTVPKVSVQPELWINPAARRMFKYIPEAGWKLVFDRVQVVDDATSIQPIQPVSEFAGLPVDTVAQLKNLNTTQLPDTSMVFLTETASLYRLNKQSAEPQSLPQNVVSNFGGCWERQTLSDFRKLFVDIGIGEAYGY